MPSRAGGTEQFGKVRGKVGFCFYLFAAPLLPSCLLKVGFCSTSSQSLLCYSRYTSQTLTSTTLPNNQDVQVNPPHQRLPPPPRHPHPRRLRHPHLRPLRRHDHPLVRPTYRRDLRSPRLRRRPRPPEDKRPGLRHHPAAAVHGVVLVVLVIWVHGRAGAASNCREADDDGGGGDGDYGGRGAFENFGYG